MAVYTFNIILYGLLTTAVLCLIHVVSLSTTTALRRSRWWWWWWQRQSLDLHSLPTLPLFLTASEHALRDADKIAIIDKTKGQCFTYRQLLADVAALKSQLLHELHRALTGDLEERRVAFLVPNGYDYVVTQWAIWAAGGVCVPLCTTHPVKELLYTIGDSEPSLIVIHSVFEKVLLSLRQQAHKNARFMSLAPLEVRNQLAPSIPLPSFSDIMPVDRRALIIYTSGTTSRPKGCVTTHQNITFQAECLIKAWQLTASDLLIHVLPLHHVHGIVNALTATLLSGGTVEMYPKFDAKTTWERWQDKGASTTFMAVPTIYSRLVDYFNLDIRGTEREPAARAGANALRLLISGSAALPTPTRNRFAQITGHILLERYGMTEIGMGISCGLDPNKRPDGSVGWPLPGVEVRLVDQESGRVIDSADEDGMIEIKGQNVFFEYWKQPAETAKAFTRDGWFKTGDIARRDRTGAYFIQGRESVDVIKSGGYKVSALEVERTMLTLESIQEAVVVGVRDEEWGQRVAAVVTQRPGTPPLELNQVRSYLKSEIATYKIPTILITVDLIDRNAMGKVDKKALVKKYWPELMN
ncbi:hypothetical protein Egran_01541 [Elaphomyces granulatus]|uniref:AMP-dependent synthetase/ligase domain-containing protein n=1 Tax=Elaphomyces granulatus TaxID=519963 RepID=A0A232M2X9_9EURO|nr:hypothetical protein Egran_01541 [Elaphomyces granulatus]